MKRVRLMMVAVLGIIVLLLSFAPMPAATTTPTGVAAAEAGGSMSVGTEVVLSNNTVATYLGKTSAGNDKWQATFEGPKYLDDLKTPIDCRWEYNLDKEEWNSCANLFNATVKDDRVTVEYQGVKMHWQPQLEIGNKQQTENGTTLLPVDPINENYPGNTLQWDYGNGITRNLRIIEGMLIEYYTISELPAGDITIKTNINKDAGFVWTRPEVAWDVNYTPVDLIVDGDDVTLTQGAMQNATLPITIDPDSAFTGSSSDVEFGIQSRWGSSRTEQWSIVHDASVADYMGTGGALAGVNVWGQKDEDEYRFGISRSVLYFDTSALPDDCIINSATLRLLKHTSLADTSSWILQVQSGMPTYPYDPPDIDDYYYEYYSGNGGTLPSNLMGGTGWKNITLSATGRSWISKTGTTKFMLRDGTYDIPDDYPPPSDPNHDNYFFFFTYEYGAGPQLVVTYETTQPLSPLERYAPILYFHPYENYYTDSIGSMLNESNLTLYKTKDDREFILENPTTDDLASHNTNKYYTDMQDAEPGFGLVYSDGSWQSITAIPPDPIRFAGYQYTIYGRQVEVDDYIVLQYWFFYPYNNWWNCHEGDMERVQIILDKATETPQRVTFGQHWGGETVTWNEVSLMSETHPEVFVGVGSHSSWPTDGNHAFASFFNDMITVTDYTSSTGLPLFPDCISSSWNNYTIVNISSEPSWVKWLGKWGYFVPGRWGGYGKCGCDSPANLVVNGINVWDNPIEWANDPGLPADISAATGPVRVHAYDSNGNHTGLNETGGIETEIPGTYFYVPASNQSDVELMWIYTEENLTFTLEATEAGECNFSFARCVEDEITTNYTHVEVIENTTATVDTGEENPLLLMELDFDSDGVTDEYKFPDSNSTLEGQVNFTGRDTPPNDRWIEPFNITLFEPGNLSNVLWTGVATTNNTGVFTIDDIPSGTYDIGIKNCTCLSELVTNVTVGVNETVEVDFGTTREGDANNDDYITISDRTLLYGAWGSGEGDPNWNPNCDFNRDGWITLADRTIMYANWGQCGDLLQ